MSQPTTRRSVLASAAWTAPVVIAAAPAASASCSYATVTLFLYSDWNRNKFYDTDGGDYPLPKRTVLLWETDASGALIGTTPVEIGQTNLDGLVTLTVPYEEGVTRYFTLLINRLSTDQPVLFAGLTLQTNGKVPGYPGDWWMFGGPGRPTKPAPFTPSGCDQAFSYSRGFYAPNINNQ